MGFKFDRTKFLRSLGNSMGKMTPEQLSGFTFLLDRIEGDNHWQSVPQIAYFLGTIWHETARTMKPITERGPRSYFRKYDIGKLAKRLGNTPTEDGDGFKYRGHGYVQNTGLTNARKAGAALAGNYYMTESGAKFMVTDKTFVTNPELLLIPAVSYDDAVDGMFTGRYTGRAVQDYINARKTDYINARRVINGLDCAEDIAGYATKFCKALDASLAVEVEPTPAIDGVFKPVPIVSVQPEAAEAKAKLQIADITKHISKDRVKTIAPKVLGKAGAGISTAWMMGATGKILITLAILIVAGVIGWQLWKYRQEVHAAAMNYLKGGGSAGEATPSS